MKSLSPYLLHFLIIFCVAGLTAVGQYVSGQNLGWIGPVIVAAATTLVHLLSGLIQQDVTKIKALSFLQNKEDDSKL